MLWMIISSTFIWRKLLQWLSCLFWFGFGDIFSFYFCNLYLFQEFISLEVSEKKIIVPPNWPFLKITQLCGSPAYMSLYKRETLSSNSDRDNGEIFTYSVNRSRKKGHTRLYLDIANRIEQKWSQKWLFHETKKTRI